MPAIQDKSCTGSPWLKTINLATVLIYNGTEKMLLMIVTANPGLCDQNLGCHVPESRDWRLLTSSQSMGRAKFASRAHDSLNNRGKERS